MVYTWLAAPDHQEHHVIACSRREEATGSWFIQGKSFKDWMRAPNSFLWLHGIRAYYIKLLECGSPLIVRLAQLVLAKPFYGKYRIEI